jgi:beta-xylosidase
MTGSAFDGYFADPFVLHLPGGGYVAYGTSDPTSSATGIGRVFTALVSTNLKDWTSVGPVLNRVGKELGDEYWAPEVVISDGVFWMFYSVGHGITGHHIRVARSDSSIGPFRDLGLNLTPLERFAIDPHPFLDIDGEWYLFFARDVVDSKRPGTHLAVAPLISMTHLGSTLPALEPNADWQMYERSRKMYGCTFDWHTLEGPTVVRRHGQYWMTYSGGAWTGPGYAVSWASAGHPLGPWNHATEGTPPLLRTGEGLTGPGHNSIVADGNGNEVIAFHAWDEKGRRTMRLRFISFEPEGPRVDGPIRGPSAPPAESNNHLDLSGTR